MSIAAQPFNTPPLDPWCAVHAIDIRDHITILFESRRLIASTTLFALICAITYLWVATPIYQADAVIQVEEKAGPSSEIEALSSFLVSEANTPAEIEILKTRKILSTVVEQLSLATVATPHYFPLVGAAIARHQQDLKPNTSSEPPVAIKLLRLLGNGYAWSTERISVSRLSVPPDLIGKPLTFVAGDDGQYDLFDEEAQHILRGRVGQAAEVETGAFSGTELYVGELLAQPGTRFKLLKLHNISAIKELKDKLTISEQGRQTGIIVVRLEGADPNQVADTVNAVVDNYVRQHVERRSEEASKMLAFLDSQLPDLKGKADSTEQALQEHRAKTGSIDLTLEAQQILNKAADVEKGISELKLQEPELQRKFTSNHPARKALEQQLTQLYALRNSLEQELKDLPGTEWETLKLARDAKVANELYTMLLNEAQELRIAKAGTVGNVRILDRAFVPMKPVKPRKMLSLVLVPLLGIIVGTILAFLRRGFTKATDDPDQLERQLGLPVYVSIPHSELAAKQEKSRRHGQPLQLISLSDKKDYTLESLRSLRTSLQFSSMSASNNLVCVSGPSPQVGKSFVCANLATLLGESGKRILLIDADMRKGYLHNYFAIDRADGLSDVLRGRIDIKTALRKTQIEKLDFLPNGIPPSNPAELLLSERFAEMLEDVSAGYDTVVIDTPPLLAVTDPAIVAKHAGTNLIVLRSGTHPLKEIEQSLKRIRQIGGVPSGFIFNDVPHQPRVYGRNKLSLNSYYYQYDYR